MSDFYEVIRMCTSENITQMNEIRVEQNTQTRPEPEITKTMLGDAGGLSRVSGIKMK